MKFRNTLLAASICCAFSLGLTACNEQTNHSTVDAAKPEQGQEAKHSETLNGQALAKKYIILDGHIDVPYRLERKWEDVSHATHGGDFDYPRAVSGGLNAPFMSIYIPASLEKTGGSKALADKLIDGVEAMVKQAPEKFAIAKSVADVKQQFAQGLISLPLGMENGSPIESDLNNLKHFYERGIRYITLTHSKANHISDSSYDTERPAKGLTDFGKTLITEMNNLGVMVDVSHISDEAFYQVMELSKVPVIASHSSARHFTPGFERNMSDDMLKQLAKNGGVVQINFGSSFISKATRDYGDLAKAKFSEFLEAQDVKANSEQAKSFREQYRKNNPYVFATLDDVLDHYDHVIKLIGVDHVGVGSDFDGVGDSLPVGLKDVASYPNLIDGLLKRGYSEQDIEKILSKNVLRVWQQVEEYAAQQNKV